MLNILITDIYSMSAVNFYEALNLPLASTINVPIRFVNEHAHLFAKNLTGVDVGIKLSHPRVVTASLDHHNQSLKLEAGASGESTVMIYLLEDPKIYDVFTVHVASML
jgi:hypothetical protein